MPRGRLRGRGSDAPVSVLFVRAPGVGRPAVAELQLGDLQAASVRPASVVLVIGAKPAATLRIDRNNHADLPGPAAAALLKALVGGARVAFVSGRTTWRLSGDGAVDALQAMDDAQGRTGRPSALVHQGGLSDADVALPMALPRFDATRIPVAPRPDDAALAVRVLASIPTPPDCPLLDDGPAQAKARLWHLDANRLLVTQACRPMADASDNGVNGFWIANLRPPYDAKPLTYFGVELDGSGSIIARTVDGPAADCRSVQSWTWNGFRFEQTYAATGGLCRGVKAGGAWELPTLVHDVIPAN